MAISLEQVKTMKPGTRLRVATSPHLYTADLVAVNGDQVWVAINQWPDNDPGLASWFDERHLEHVTVVGEPGPVSSAADDPDPDKLAGENAPEPPVKRAKYKGG